MLGIVCHQSDPEDVPLTTGAETALSGIWQVRRER